MELKCSGITGKVFGHKFEARMSIVPPNAATTGMKMSGSNIIDILDRLSKKIYECDVCVRCGAVVNKKKSASFT